MRFMVIVKANKDSEAGKMPTEEMLTEMGKFNCSISTANRCRSRIKGRDSSRPQDSRKDNGGEYEGYELGG